MKQILNLLCSAVFMVSFTMAMVACGEEQPGCNQAEPDDCATPDESDVPLDEPVQNPDNEPDPATPDEPQDPEEPTEPTDSQGECEPPILTPLYDADTELERDVLVDTPDALVSYLADRARDRHAREDIVNGIPFQQYDHYLSFYWEQRVANIEIVDRVAKGGSGVTFNFMTLAELNPAEFRTFYANTGSVAVYHNNMSNYLNQGVTLTEVVPSVDYPGEQEFHYTATIYNQSPENRPLVIGDRIEVELSQFLLSPRNGRTNYYGTAFLYVVGEGVLPWYAKEREEAITEFERQNASFDSFPLPELGRL
ncbi:MAG: hypothetical protein HOI23_22790, partial [Deltaproteobacteria bacterium]|nr:hypothetical protein [Deltaproteobacteria bacterium]